MRCVKGRASCGRGDPYASRNRWHTDAVRPVRRRLGIVVAAALATVLALTACGGSTATVDEDTTAPASEDPSTQEPSAEQPSTQEPSTQEPSTQEPSAQEPSADDDLPPEPPEPVPYRPAGPIGSADAYNSLIAEIEAELPAAIRADVPWPDLRHPDPAQAQVEIFDLWIWVIEHHPDPAFANAMAAPDSPSRADTAVVFGEMKDADELHMREQAPYVAFDHRVVTFESAGLPLWLARDVPADAVVVYYQDQSGPTVVRDRDSGESRYVYGEHAARQWLSIMVPTEAGWMLFRDQLIERGDSELDVPALPDPDTDPRTDV